MRQGKGMGLANMSGGDCRGGRGKFYIVKKLPQCQNVGEKLCGAQRCCVSGTAFSYIVHAVHTVCAGQRDKVNFASLPILLRFADVNFC